MANLSPAPKLQFFDANGNPLAGGKLYTYAAGTTTPLATYTDAGGGTPNANPIVLDSRGEANVWLGSASYKLKLTTSTDVEIWTVDNIASYNYDVLTTLAASGGSALVGFLQSGSGATARTVQAKLRDAISVKDFGAVGNGVADDTTAIQNALNTGKSVYVPDGTYLISSEVTLQSGQKFYGSGTLKRTTSGFLVTATSVSNVSILGLVFDGDKDSWAINFKTVTNGRIEGCRCVNVMLAQTTSINAAVYANVTSSDMCNGIIIKGNIGLCSVTPTAQSQQFIRVLYTQNFVVSNNESNGYREHCLAWGGDGNVDYAAANERKCWNGSITGNTAKTLAAGIWTSMARDVVISGNALEGNNVAEGIGTESGFRNSFVGNKVFNYQIGTYIRALVQDILFDSNLVVQPGGSSNHLFNNETNTFYADQGNVTITNNVMKATGALAGFLPYVVNVLTIRGNHIENAFPQVISSQGVGEVILENNEIVSSYAPATPANPTYCVYVGGIRNGFTVQSQQPRCVIKNNQIEFRGSQINNRGIAIGGNSVATLYEITGNEIFNIRAAITLETGTGACTSIVRNNVIDSATVYPQVIFGGAHTVLWQDNMNTAGVDAYGSVSGFAAVPYFSVGSRIWASAPSASNPPGWVCVTAGQSGTWKAMANLAA